jgi:hypothetical protein
VGLGIAASLAVTVLVAQTSKAQNGANINSGALETWAQRGSSEPIFKRVQAEIAGLRAESLEQSLANLGDWELWEYPGAFIEEGGRLKLPLEDTEGTGTVHRILSNRRFLKVYQQVGALVPARAAAVVNTYFPIWFQQYSAKYAKYVEKGRQLSPASVESGGPGTSYIGGWGGGTDDDGLPSLQCMRWRLLGLVLIAGNLRLQGTAPWVQKIAEEARAQRDYLYQAGEELSTGFRFVAITRRSLYNRQILGYALIRTSSQPERGLAMLAAGPWVAPTVEVRLLTVFDAVRTPYDMGLMGGPVDYSKGSLTVEHLPPITDGRFDTILTVSRGH